MRRFWVGLGIALMLLGHGTTAAREIRQGDQCLVGANETIQGDLFALCRTLSIQGHVQGDLIGAALDAEISGIVEGSVYVAAGQLDVSGTLGSDLHFAGSVLRILPQAEFTDARAHLISLSLSTTLDEAVSLPDSIVAAGYQMVLNGDTGGEISFWGSALTLKGRVGGDVNAVVGDPASTGISQLQTFLAPFNWDFALINPGLTVVEQSLIEGDLRYSGPVEGAVQGQVKGQTVFTQFVTQPDLNQIISEQESAGVYLTQIGREFIVLVLIGLLGLLFLPRPLQNPLRQIQSRPLPSLSVGLLAFIVSFPIAMMTIALIVIIIVILLLLHFDNLVIALFSVALVGTWSGAISLFYFVAIFISRVMVCLLVGRVLVRLFLRQENNPRLPYLSLLIGAGALSILMSLPVVGLLISALVAFLGLGAILMTTQAQFRRYRETMVGGLQPHAPLFAGRARLPRALPPPELDDEPEAPGMENLPEGFRWWDS